MQVARTMTLKLYFNLQFNMRKLLIAIFAITTSLCAWAGSQNEIVLNQARFHKGDAPHGWMSVDFDDSSWEIIAIPDKWHGEGLYAQYRIKFNVPEGFITNAPYKQYAYVTWLILMIVMKHT